MSYTVTNYRSKKALKEALDECNAKANTICVLRQAYQYAEDLPPKLRNAVQDSIETALTELSS